MPHSEQIRSKAVPLMNLVCFLARLGINLESTSPTRLIFKDRHLVTMSPIMELFACVLWNSPTSTKLMSLRVSLTLIIVRLFSILVHNLRKIHQMILSHITFDQMTRNHFLTPIPTFEKKAAKVFNCILLQTFFLLESKWKWLEEKIGYRNWKSKTNEPKQNKS